MDKRFILYYFAIVVFSTLAMFGKFFADPIFYLTLITLAIVHIFYFKIYSRITGLNLSNGLFYSVIFGVVVLLILTNFDLSIETQNRYTDYSLYASLLITFICFIIYFSIDRLFNKSKKGISKLKLLFSSLAFYSINYIISFGIAMVYALARALSFS